MYSLGLMFLMSEQYFVVKAKDLGMKIEDIIVYSKFVIIVYIDLFR